MAIDREIMINNIKKNIGGDLCVKLMRGEFIA